MTAQREAGFPGTWAEFLETPEGQASTEGPGSGQASRAQATDQDVAKQQLLEGLAAPPRRGAAQRKPPKPRLLNEREMVQLVIRERYLPKTAKPEVPAALTPTEVGAQLAMPVGPLGAPVDPGPRARVPAGPPPGD